eukprot:6173053-Pleurochrysis_carterae.AAC.8
MQKAVAHYLAVTVILLGVGACSQSLFHQVVGTPCYACHPSALLFNKHEYIQALLTYVSMYILDGMDRLTEKCAG